MIKAIIFDLDGTLIEFKLDVYSSKNEVIHLIKRELPNIVGLDVSQPYHLMLRKVRGFVDEKTFESIKLKVFKVLDKFEEKAVQETSLKEGARDALIELNRLGIRITLLTNSGKTATINALKKFGIIDLFEIVLSREDVEFLKPSTSGFKKMLTLLNLDASECLSVGDGLIDLIPSKALGIKFVAVTGGYNPIEKMLEHRPDYVVNSLSELPMLVSEL